MVVVVDENMSMASGMVARRSWFRLGLVFVLSLFFCLLCFCFVRVCRCCLFCCLLCRSFLFVVFVVRVFRCCLFCCLLCVCVFLLFVLSRKSIGVRVR